MDDGWDLVIKDEHWKYNNTDNSEYRNIQKLIKSKVRTVKNEWLRHMKA